MAMNIGRAVNLIELWCKGADPKLSQNHELVRQIMNMKLREFAGRTALLESKSTISSVAAQQEYQLPSDVLHIKDVIYDDYRAHKITHKQVKELQGQT